MLIIYDIRFLKCLQAGFKITWSRSDTKYIRKHKMSHAKSMNIHKNTFNLKSAENTNFQSERKKNTVEPQFYDIEGWQQNQIVK